MALTLDIITVGIMLLCVYFGCKNGLVKTLYRLLRTFGSFISALIFAKPVSLIIAETPFLKGLVEGISKKIEDIEFISPDVGEVVSLEESLTPAARELLHGVGVSLSEISEKFSSMIQLGQQSVKEGIKDYIIEPIAESLSFTISFVLVFALTALALKIASVLLEGTLKIVGLQKVNRVLGFVMGLVQGLIYAAVFCMVVVSFSPWLSSVGIEITPSRISDTYIFKQISEMGFSVVSSNNLK